MPLTSNTLEELRAENERLRLRLEVAEAAVEATRDGTQRRAAETTDQKTNERVVALMENLTEGLCVLDRNYRFTYVNAAAERINGISRDALLGRTQWEVFPGGVGTDLDRQFRRTMLERVTSEFENFYAPWGRWYALKTYPASDGGICVLYRDITESKRVAGARHHAEARLRRVFDTQTVGMIEWNFDRGLITTANGHFLEMVGYSPEDVAAGRLDFRAMTPPQWTAQNEEGIKAIRSTGRAPAYESEYLRKDGTRVPILIAGVRFEDRDNEGMSVIIDLTESKRAAHDCRVSEERFRAAVGAVSSIMWTNNALGMMTGEQTGWENFTGQDRESYQGFGWARVVHPDDAQPTINAWNDAVARKETFVFEHRVLRRDGQWRICSIRAVPVFDGQGNIAEWVGVHTDITEQRRAESVLRASEVRFRQLFESAKDGILILDGHAATITDANPYIAEMLGYSRDQLVGKELWQIGLFKDVEASKSAMRKLQEQGYIRYEDLPLETKAGRRINVEFVSNLYSENGGAVIQCNIRDITKRRETEQSLKKALIYADDIIATLREPFVVLDGDLRVKTANRSFYDSFHVSKEETEKRFVYDLGNGQWDIPALRTLLDRVLSRSESVHDFEVEHTFPDLGRKTMLLNARPFPPDCEFPELILLAVEDVSANRERANELAEGNRRKDEFLATLAHELRNPLAPIRNGLQIMNLAQVDAGMVEKTRSMMERQVEQMTRLIDDLMDLSRINQGKIILQKTRILLADAVRNAVDTSHPLLDAQRHELVVDMPPEPIYLEGDLTRLSQVFTNLLNNSAKYTDLGGRIRLTVERQGDDAVVSVADNGVGIPADMLSHVFDMFAQINGSLEKSQGGLGIGLNIVKRLVKMHGGSIHAESGGPGMGSMFTVRLPTALSGPDEKSADQITDEKRLSAACRRILVVDDNQDGAFSLAMMLKLMGNDTQTANDGLEAVALSEAFKPNVILMDIGMPKLNGYDACRRIREQPWAEGIVIIALTGWGQEEDRQKSKDAGFNGHFVKPVDHAALMRFLENS